MNPKEEKNKRINLAKEKGLIINDDNSIYSYVLKVYRLGVDIFINEIININKYDQMIDNSNLGFNSSINFNKNKGLLNSKYFQIINNYYIEKLSIEDLNILKNKKNIDNEVLQIINKTLKQIIHKDNVNKIMYFPNIPERVANNDTLVFDLVIGKDTLINEDFVQNKKSQEEILMNIKNKLIEEIENKMKINTTIFYRNEF